VVPVTLGNGWEHLIPFQDFGGMFLTQIADPLTRPATENHHVSMAKSCDLAMENPPSFYRENPVLQSKTVTLFRRSPVVAMFKIRLKFDHLPSPASYLAFKRSNAAWESAPQF
jgi:hypothetical protein